MAANKNTSKKAAPKKSSAKTNKEQSAASKRSAEQRQETLKLKEEIRGLKEQQNRENTLRYQLMPPVLLFLGVFFAICFIIPEKMGVLKYLTILMQGLFSVGAYLIPVSLVIMAFFWKRDYANGVFYKRVILFTALVTIVASICRLGDGMKTFNVKTLFTRACDLKGGGIVGGYVGGGLEKITGVGAWIILCFTLVLCAFAAVGITPADITAFIVNKFREMSYNINTNRQQRLKESVAKQESTENSKVKTANEQYAIREEEEAREIRKKRAYIEEDEEDNADATDATQEKVVESNLVSEIRPVLSDDDAVPPKNVQSGYDTDAQGYVNVDAFDDVVRKNNIERELINGSPDFEQVKIDSFEQLCKNSQMSESKDGQTNESADFSSIFTDDASIAIAGAVAGAKDVSDGEALGAVLSERASELSDDTPGEEKESLDIVPEPTLEEIYTFPTIEFLQKDPNPLTFTVTEELKQTSVKLVETLRNFGVKTKIMNICCGPTVTRYELQPEIGVRVRAIANLSDDIALHLAAAGVRIEAPIPGKDTVGIEVPNKTVSTVYLRNLIENTAFEGQKSKLTVGLGMDVAGTPVYMNIAKMPHLLIAGATGMGKSVCINSFIVSLLYKARPDEVKLILIDPKKVELSIYNGLPHLLVPVVSDPKKAAGSLAWAVNEMERRFLLIEEVGVRDLDTYNEVTRDDPEKEYLPKIVIIIDELADLMMTARVEVETSICRIAQKARAAGMHLVIGTQRPSVDVITGLIKANVPSRIACTVASQVDSRTIIDVSGAEKLLGRGDMLYAPVGCMKPIRVQGSFVSEKEIENIVSFLKDGYTANYDNDIIESIEREAAKCGEKKKGKGASSGGSDDFSGEDKATILASDDAIFPAMEIAVEAGQVSTSLLQRKLSLGYSRAARIVDKLEKLGVVGPFEGSKPRKVLITYEEYLEMRMNYEGGGEE